MNKTIGMLIGAAGFALVVPLGIIALALNGRGDTATASPTTIVSVGNAAPDFTLPTQDGRTMHLADYKGRAVFLAFVPDWTSADTAKEMKALAKTQGDFDMAGAKVMVVSSDTPAAATNLHNKNKLPFPLLHDDNGILARTFGVGAGMRRTYVVSPAGQVKYRVDNSVMDIANHGQQLLDVSKCCVDEVTASRANGIGKPVGDYSLPVANSADHAMTTLYGDGTQKLTVALILSSKCPCSNTYNKRVVALNEEFVSQGVRLVGVYSNADETIEEIEAHAKANGFTFPVMKDEKGLCAAHLGAAVTPEVFVIDSAKDLRYAGRIDDSRDLAEVKHHDLTDAIHALLTGKEPPKATRAFGCAIVK